MAYQLDEINRRLRQDPAGFVAECDAHFQKRLEHAADLIVENRKFSPIALLSGPSGSGKTTTALKLKEELEKRGIGSHTVSMDNYFLSAGHRDLPRTPEGNVDFESPKMLDMALLGDTFARLTRGEEVIVPKFEFARQMRNDSRGTSLCLGKNEIAIFEGIHALNDAIVALHPEATTMYISACSNVMEGDLLRFKCTWMRLTRRAVRDYNFRGTDVAETLSMWANVRRGEKLYISPFRDRAKVTIDSSMRYEVPLMRNFAQPLLEAVPTENQRRDELLTLIHAFDYFEPLDPQLVPSDSLLREFIGGGSYRY